MKSRIITANAVNIFGTKLKLANMWTPQHSQLQVIVLEIPQTHENSPY